MYPYIPAPVRKKSVRKDWFQLLKERPLQLKMNYQLGYETGLLKRKLLKEKHKNQKVIRSLAPSHASPRPELKLTLPQQQHIQHLISSKLRNKTLEMLKTLRKNSSTPSIKESESNLTKPSVKATRRGSFFSQISRSPPEERQASLESNDTKLEDINPVSPTPAIHIQPICSPSPLNQGIKKSLTLPKLNNHLNSPRIVIRKASHQGFLQMQSQQENKANQERKTFLHTYLKKFDPEPSLKTQILDYFKEIKLTRKNARPVLSPPRFRKKQR